MSLPAGQQSVLDRIEGGLQASEPHLSSMYAIFARLSEGEPVTREKLKAGRFRWLQQGSVVYAVVLVPVMFVAIITGILAGGSTRGAACKTGFAATTSGAAVPAGTGGAGTAPPAHYVTLAGKGQGLSPPDSDASAMAGSPSGVC